MKNKINTCGVMIFTSLAVALSTFPASAQIIATSSATHFQNSTPDVAINTMEYYETPHGFNRKLIVTASWEGSALITNISYGSQFFTEAVTRSAGRTSSIWYLDAPDYGGRDIVVMFDRLTDSRIGALCLVNAVNGAPAQTAIGSSINTTADDALVVGVYTENGGGALSSDFANTLYSGNSGSCVGNTGYQNEPAAGTKLYTWNAVNNDGAIAMAAFDYVAPTGTLDPQAIDDVLAQTVARQERGLAMQLDDTFPATGPWFYECFALAAYGLDTDTEVADAGMIAMQTNGAYKAQGYHWHAYLQARMYFLYSSQSDFFPGRMSAAAEDAVLEMLWDWAALYCDIDHADPASINFVWESENHMMQAWVSLWGAAQIFANHPYYQTQTYADGSTPTEMATAFNAFFKAWLRERSAKGLLVEVNSPTYSKYTLNTLYNLVDFATDPELKTAAGAMLDIYFAEWAMEQIDGVRGGSRHRCYPGKESTTHRGGGAETAWYHFGVGGPGKHPGAMSGMSTFWRPSRAVIGLALDTEGRGSYGYASRGPGLKDPASPPQPPALQGNSNYYALDPEGGSLLRTTWCTPDFVMGMSQMDVLPASAWTAISSQNRWNGVIFGGHKTARIFTQRPDPAVGSVYNAEWGVQNKGAMILQRLSTHQNATGQAVWFDASLTRSEISGWIFAASSDAYAAVRVVDGGWSWNGNWAELIDEYSPVIIEVGRKSDYSGYSAFRSEILSNPLVWDGTRLDYTSTAYATTLTLFADESAPPRVDGVPLNFEAKKAYDSPYLEGEFGSGPVIIQYGDDRTVHGVAPFADTSDTQALWHFEALASGTDYEDDTSVTARTALDAVVHVDSTAGITEIADGKFGNAIRCEFVAGDQYMLTGSSLWPADMGSFRYQGWIRLNPGDTGGALLHIYDQVFLSVTTASVSFKINRSGDILDVSAANQIELSAMIDGSNDWQYIEAVYDGERIQLVTAMETVSAPGIGLFVPDQRSVYIGSRKNKFNYVGDMDEVKLSAFMPQPVVVAASAKHLQVSDPDIATNTIVNFAPVVGADCKLVVTASWESGTSGIAGVTYAGVSFSEAVSIYAGRQSSIWYLDLDEQSPSSGDVVVTFNTRTDSLIGVLSLENAAAGVPIQIVADTGSTTLSLTASAHNSLSVGVYTENDFGALSSDFVHTLYSGNSGSSVGNAGYQLEAVAGAQSYQWTAANASSASVVANFAPTPHSIAALADDDADGMADVWEIEQFGTLGASSQSSNTDGDAWTDLQEFIAGTDPWDPASMFKISAMSADSIAWWAVQGKTYRVLSTEDLTEAWGVEATGLQGDPPESSYFFSTEPEQKFFKIEIE
jgi:hypothetical protein